MPGSGTFPEAGTPLPSPERRELLVRHKSSGIDADIIFGALAFEEESIGRAMPLDVGGIRLQCPTPEDLIVMKAVAHRPRDLADIESILDAQLKLNLTRVRRLVRGFSIALEMPEILNDLEAILARMRKKSKQ
ncbi:MAG: nucleotidyltransferase [candidate division NC10 bacterium]|nr:nucleotidyltransferase [candidate division NC10 bacterium]